MKELRQVGLEMLDIQIHVSTLKRMAVRLGFDTSGLSQNTGTVHWIDAAKLTCRLESKRI